MNEDLIRCQFAFADEQNPSIGMIAEPEGDSTAWVIVAPKGIDRYPKFIVHFKAVYSLRCEEEAGSPGYPSVATMTRDVAGACAYTWPTSPWVEGYSKVAPDMPFCGGTGPMKHFLFLGADNVIGVVSAENPTVERIDSATHKTINYEV